MATETKTLIIPAHLHRIGAKPRSGGGLLVDDNDVLYTEAGGLCNCCSDPGGACFACCCYPCAFGQAMQDGLGGSCFVWCCGARLPYVGLCVAAYGADKLNTRYGGKESIVKYVVLALVPCTACCHACTVIRGAKNAKEHRGSPSEETMVRGTI